ncbi:MAG: hypothetical protein RBS37_05145 [Bacteroidales bacterium]|jgi:hypothetical protein|nr:hypothetical protein [Bacteroidales bacterium]
MKRYSLEARENTRFVKVLQVIFGIICIFIAIWWAVYILNSPDNIEYWAASVFMFGFGAFQIYSGLGYASRYILTGSDTIVIKKSAIGRRRTIKNVDIGRIDIHPLSVSFLLKDNTTIKISFAVTLAGDIDRIKDAAAAFGRKNNIITEEGTEGK